MTPEEIQELLEAVAGGSLPVEDGVARLMDGPLRRDELPFATLDHHRKVRQGLAEVVFGEGKTLEETLEIAERLSAPGSPVLLTRLGPDQMRSLKDRFPHGRTNARARTVLLNPTSEKDPEDGSPFVAVVSGGTADLPVAEEAAEVCLAMDVPVRRIYDVGVAGLHRVLAHVDSLRKASALVVVAGMEGALPSVVGGLVSAPVFAVPTSVGYGASFQGLAALLAMLNSCAPGVMVSNIDNGFSAGIAAARVARTVAIAHARSSSQGSGP
jgi:NCAIR mutase (PurE)-related protein